MYSKSIKRKRFLTNISTKRVIAETKAFYNHASVIAGNQDFLQLRIHDCVVRDHACVMEVFCYDVACLRLRGLELENFRQLM